MPSPPPLRRFWHGPAIGLCEDWIGLGSEGETPGRSGGSIGGWLGCWFGAWLGPFWRFCVWRRTLLGLG